MTAIPGFASWLVGVAVVATPPDGAAAPPVPYVAVDSLATAGVDAPVVLVPVPDTVRVYRAPLVEVRARRLNRQSLLDRSPAAASVLEGSSWAGGVSSTSQALAGAVGVHVRESGAIGSYSTISLRGASASQVPIYLDGVPLNAPGAGEVDLADIPLAALERIEVYRGAAPLMLGGGSLGGAIHCFSARGASPPWVSAAAGSYGTLELQGGLGRDAGVWNLGARGRWVRSDGDWEFDDDRGTLYNPEDDTRSRRGNNDVRGGGMLISARRPVGGWMLGGSALIDGREQGVPGYAVDPAQHARSQSLTAQARWSLERPRALPLGLAPDDAAGDGGLQSGVPPRWLRGLDVYARYDGQGFEDREGELGLGPADRTDRTWSGGGSAWGELAGALQRAFPVLETGWRVEAQYSRLRSVDDLARAPEGEPQTRRTAAAAVQPALPLWRGRIALLGGARVELHDDRFHGVPFGSGLATGPADRTTTWARTLQLGARARLLYGLDLRANVGVHERVPTLLERFGARGTVVGNAGLRPESGVNRDLGLVWSRAWPRRAPADAAPADGGEDTHEAAPPRASQRPALEQRVSISVFHNDAHDLIAFTRNSQRTVVPLNVGAAEIEGLELEAALGIPGLVASQGNLTLLRTRDRTDTRFAQGQQLPGRPDYELDVRVTIGGSGRPAAGWTLAALGADYLDRANRDEVPPRALHGVFVEFPLPWPASSTLLRARVDNLGDEQVYDLAGWPLPGRTFTLSLAVGGNHVR